MTRSIAFWPTRRQVPMLRDLQVKFWMTVFQIREELGTRHTDPSLPTLPGLLVSVFMTIPPFPYAPIPGERPRKSLANGFPDSEACRARYCRIESGIPSQSSAVSMLFFTSNFILARLYHVNQYSIVDCAPRNGPVLEPYLHRSLRHVDVLGYSLADWRGWRGVFIELDFQSYELILRRSLTLLILLLLSEGAFSWWSARVGGRADRGRGGRRRS